MKKYYGSVKNNPDVQFLIVDAANGEGIENLTGVEFKAEEPSFLVGYIVFYSETNKVGFVGGQESTLIKALAGYHAGVDQAAKEKGQKIEFISQYVGNFSDAAKGKSTDQYTNKVLMS